MKPSLPSGERPKPCLENFTISRKRIGGASRLQYKATNDQGKQDAEDGGHDSDPAWIIKPRFNSQPIIDTVPFHDSTFVPAIIKPTVLRFARSGGNSPTIMPSYMTAIRSASENISSNSSEINKMAVP